MKKFFLLGLIFILCGCTSNDESVETVSKIGVAKNSVSGYANAVMAAYTDYKYNSLVGEYVIKDNSTVVNIDGVDVNLNVNYYDENLTCSVIRIVNDSVQLDDCSIYGYNFMYNGEVLEK